MTCKRKTVDEVKKCKKTGKPCTGQGSCQSKKEDRGENPDQKPHGDDTPDHYDSGIIT